MRYNNVRLREHEVQAIISAFREHFGSEDNLFLFGSRADLSKKGGDIDLYIETSQVYDNLFRKQRDLYNAIIMKIGEQRIDIVIKQPGDKDLLIYRMAQKTGVKLT